VLPSLALPLRPSLLFPVANLVSMGDYWGLHPVSCAPPQIFPFTIFPPPLRGFSFLRLRTPGPCSQFGSPPMPRFPHSFRFPLCCPSRCCPFLWLLWFFCAPQPDTFFPRIFNSDLLVFITLLFLDRFCFLPGFGPVFTFSSPLAHHIDGLWHLVCCPRDRFLTLCGCLLPYFRGHLFSCVLFRLWDPHRFCSVFAQ